MTANNEMTLAELRHLLELYGADRSRWPAHERRPALALIEHSAKARDLVTEAEALDTLLARATTPEPSPELMAEILAAASQSKWQAWSASIWPFGAIWKPVSALAAAIMLGIVAGTIVPNPLDDGEMPVDGEIGQVVMQSVFDQENQ